MPILGAFILPHPPVILPEVGHGREQALSATIRAFQACAERIRALDPETVVVVSSHATSYTDYFHISPGAGATGDMARFGAPEARLTVAYDQALAQRIAKEATGGGIPAGTNGERDRTLDHGTFVPLIMLRSTCPEAQIVRIGLSGLSALSHYRLGQAIARAVDALGRRAILLASGDLSHKLAEDGPYGYTPEGPVYDERITRAMAQGDFLDFLSIPRI